MPNATMPGLQEMLLQREIEEFFYAEADLLDERKFDKWLDLFTDDVRYWMPLVRNFQFRDASREFSREGVDNAWMDEGKPTLAQRVKQLSTGIHWAEEPQSRMSHLITNVRVLGATPDTAGAQELQAKSRFLVYRNRLESEVDILVGKRVDTLRKVDGNWKISRRKSISIRTCFLPRI